jgi:hypothetical protein
MNKTKLTDAELEAKLRAQEENIRQAVEAQEKPVHMTDYCRSRDEAPTVKEVIADIHCTKQFKCGRAFKAVMSAFQS